MCQIVGAILGAKRLILAIDRGSEAAKQRVLGIAGKQCIPLRPPQHLDDVPAGAAEGAFQFLDDLAVAAHGTVEALQVAVDDEGQVVELFTSRDRKTGDRFRLIHLAVAEHAPDMAALGVGEAAVVRGSA
jgi:hypothetical protein